MNNSTFDNLSQGGNKAFRSCYGDMLCPHCGYYSPAEGAAFGDYWILTCHKCKASVFIQVTAGAPNWQVVDYYPKNKPHVDALVPQEIGEDYLEAQRCFSVAAWQACCVMARRCMHEVVEHFTAA